jgi:hypothetical protein
MHRGAVVALLGFTIAPLAPPPSRRVPSDALEAVARALIAAPDDDKCIVLPDTLRMEIAGTRPIRICVDAGSEVVRERSGRILALTVRSRFDTYESAERAVDSIRVILIPILGIPRQCRSPFIAEWGTPKYHASIDIEANSDVVRPDRLWRARVDVERKGRRQPCAP